MFACCWCVACCGLVAFVLGSGCNRLTGPVQSGCVPWQARLAVSSSPQLKPLARVASRACAHSSIRRRPMPLSAESDSFTRARTSHGCRQQPPRGSGAFGRLRAPDQPAGHVLMRAPHKLWLGSRRYLRSALGGARGARLRSAQTGPSAPSTANACITLHPAQAPGPRAARPAPAASLE